MSLTISADHNMMHIPNRNFLFGGTGMSSGTSVNETDKNRAYSVTISQEGLEKLKQNTALNTIRMEKADQYKSILSKAQIDVAGTIEAE